MHAHNRMKQMKMEINHFIQYGGPHLPTYHDVQLGSSTHVSRD